MLEAIVHYQFEAFDYCCLKQFTRHVITSLYFVKIFFTIWKVVKEVLGGAEMPCISFLTSKPEIDVTYAKFESFLMVVSCNRMVAARLLSTTNPFSQSSAVGVTRSAHGRRPNFCQAA